IVGGQRTSEFRARSASSANVDRRFALGAGRYAGGDAARTEPAEPGYATAGRGGFAASYTPRQLDGASKAGAGAGGGVMAPRATAGPAGRMAGGRNSRRAGSSGATESLDGCVAFLGGGRRLQPVGARISG